MSSSFVASQEQLAALRAEADAAVSEVSRIAHRQKCVRAIRTSFRLFFSGPAFTNSLSTKRAKTCSSSLSGVSSLLSCVFLRKREPEKAEFKAQRLNLSLVVCHPLFSWGRRKKSTSLFFLSNLLTPFQLSKKRHTKPNPGAVGLGDEGGERGPPRGRGVPEGGERGRRRAAPLGRGGAGRGAGLAGGGAGRRGAVPRGGPRGAAARPRAGEGGGGAAEGKGREGSDEDGGRLCFGVCEPPPRCSCFFLFPFPRCCRRRAPCHSRCCSAGLALDAGSRTDRQVPFARGSHAPDLELLVVRRGRRRRGGRRGRRRGPPPRVSSPRPRQAALRGRRAPKNPRDAQDGPPGPRDGQTRGVAFGDELGRRRRWGEARRSCCDGGGGGGGDTPLAGGDGDGGSRGRRRSSSSSEAAAAATGRPIPRRLHLQDWRPVAAFPESDRGGGSGWDSSRRGEAHCGGERGRSRRRKRGGGRERLDPAPFLRRGRGESRFREARQSCYPAAAASSAPSRAGDGDDSESCPVPFAVASAARSSNSDSSGQEPDPLLFFVVVVSFRAPSSLAVRQRHRMEGRAPSARAPGRLSSGDADCGGGNSDERRRNRCCSRCSSSCRASERLCRRHDSRRRRRNFEDFSGPEAAAAFRGREGCGGGATQAVSAAAGLGARGEKLKYEEKNRRKKITLETLFHRFGYRAKKQNETFM